MVKSANIGAGLWSTFSAFRAELSVSEFGKTLLELLFLRYIDLRFEEATRVLEAQGKARNSLKPEDYQALGLRYVPEQARFSALLAEPTNPGARVYHAIWAVWSSTNETPMNDVSRYAGFRADALLRLISAVATTTESSAEIRSAYEWVLAKCITEIDFGVSDSLAELMVRFIEPTHGTVFDPACGFGQLLLHCAQYTREPNSTKRDLQYQGTDRSREKAAFCKMNLLVHDIAAEVRNADLFSQTQTETFDFIVSNPPWNQHGLHVDRIAENDSRFRFGLPTTKNANYLWIQLIHSALRHNGRAAFVMPPTAGTTRGSELEIRKRLIQSGDVEAIVALSSQLMLGTSLPTVLWVFNKEKSKSPRKNSILFIDARHIHQQVERGRRELSSEQLAFLTTIVDRYRAGNGASGHDLERPGLCKVATLDEIELQNWDLSPGRYVGIAAPDAFRLRSLYLKNVYGFEELQIDFPEGQATVLVGINGAGKSTILDSIAMFLSPLAALLRQTDPKKAPYLMGPFVIRAGEKQVEAHLDVQIAGSTQRWKLSSGRISSKRVIDTSMRSWVERVHDALEADETASVPILCYYPAVRFHGHHGAGKKRTKDAESSIQQLAAFDDAFDLDHQSFADVVDWFRREEDLENEIRLAGNPEHRNPRLDAVRQAVLRFMDTLSSGVFDDLRVRRDPRNTTHASLVLRKEETELSIDTLSDGERGVMLLVADLAQRLAAANPSASDPLSGAGVVLIDEIELHLHPRWQRAVLPELIRTFRGCQFIVTTHSPQVLSRVPREQIRLLSKFHIVQHFPETEGRDTNAILTELMGVSARPEEAEAEIAELARLIDDEAFDDARLKWQELESRWPTDNDVLRLGAMLRALEEDAP